MFNTFIVYLVTLQVEEFSKNIYAKHLNPVGEDVGTFACVVLKWTDDKGSEPSESPEPDPNKSLSTASNLDEEEPKLSTITFKCIGVTRDSMYVPRLLENSE